MILRKYKWHLLIVAFLLLLLLVEPSQQAQQGKTRIFTDMMSTEEFRRCGLSKLTPKELDALNDWMLKTFVELRLKMQKSEGEITLYDNDGTPTAYIAVDEDFTIYLWSGTPVAYLSDDSIYGFNGKHLGWFYKGVVYDQNGRIAGTIKTKAIFSTKSAPAKGMKKLTPLKSLKELKPLKPLFSISKSEIPLKVFLANTQRGPSSTPQGEGKYLRVGRGHWVSKVLEGGKYVILEDNSLWEVSPLDQITSMLWLVTENITVVENKGGLYPLYPYKLINSDSKNAVEAKYLGFSK